jgi:hypothetical protein
MNQIKDLRLVHYRFALSNLLIDEFIAEIKNWNVIFQEFQIAK